MSVQLSEARPRQTVSRRRELEDMILDNLLTGIQHVETYLVWLTPELAGRLLLRNEKNRPVVKKYIHTLSRTILNGEWELNGEAIVVSDTGRLLQGQHRCLAVIEADAPIKVLLVVGVLDSAFSSFDRGKKRTTADVFSIDGETNASTMAAAAKLMFEYVAYGDPYKGSRDVPSSKELLDVLANNPDLRDSAGWVAGAIWTKRNMTPAMATFCHLVFHRHNPTAAASFFQSLEKGAGLEDGDPVLLLRERLAADLQAKTRLINRYKCALVFKAFRHHCRGQKMKLIRVHTDGEHNEKQLFGL